jgi:hypothetical protein
MISPTVILATTTSLYQSLFPTLYPTGKDGWECVLKNYTQYLDVPMPTGDLQGTIISKGQELLKTCTLIDKLRCQQPDRTAWCDLPTLMPSSLLPEYSSFASSASSWWYRNKPAMLSLAAECPEGWHWYATIPKQSWLNNTINFAECNDRMRRAQGTNGVSTQVAAPTPAPSPTRDVQEARKTAISRGIRNINGAEIWVNLATRLAVVAANDVW